MMIFSPIVIANEDFDYENIEVDTDEEGNPVLKLTKEQFIKLADYIEELKTENKRINAKLDQAEIELKKAYEKEKGFDLTRLSDTITGAGIASLIILLAQNID